MSLDETSVHPALDELGASSPGRGHDRIAALQAEVGSLRDEVASLREDFDAFRRQFE